jgi:GR25 family glycosyltransferase involved in LPS biosynthesis
MKQLPGEILAPLENVSFSIPTYIINLKKRSDRKAHVLEQFAGREEFALTIVEAFEHSFGALGLWMTIRYILQDRVADDAEYIIIGEDDIEFTEHYSIDCLLNAIVEAKLREADVLLGGVSWFNDALQVADCLFWTDNFSGLQFTVLFRKFFQSLVEAKLKNYLAADFKIASLTNSALFMHPPMAIQKDFGYSDATAKNNVEGRVPGYFESVTKRLTLINTIKSNINDLIENIDAELNIQDYDTVIIPTYVINLPERTERLAHIKQEFLDKPEFDVQIIEACKHEVGALGLWLSIRKVIELAITNDDDVIVICEDDHQFTPHYSKEYLIKNIIEAHEEGVCFLSGGTGRFENAIPITPNRYWVYYCLSTQFIVVYKKFFQQILDEPYDEEIIADLAYSRMTSNKMVLYPFISIQKEFGYSDITAAHKGDNNLVTNMFIQSNLKFKRIQEAYIKYHPQNNILQSTEKYA